MSNPEVICVSPVKTLDKDNHIGMTVIMEEDDTDLGSDTYVSVDEDFISSGEEPEEWSEKCASKSEETQVTEVSSGYESSSEDENIVKPDGVSRPTDNNIVTDSVTDSNFIKEITEMYNLNSLTDDLKSMILMGVVKGLNYNDYNVPTSKPDWLDMEKFKRGQAFARKYFYGVNISEMASLFILFGLPGGLETLVFSDNSSTPFTSFQRYLSTVSRIASWYDYDIWSKGNPGYQNIKVVRSMHLNISNRINSTPFEDLKIRATLSENPEKPSMWNTTIRDTIKQDLTSGCPFQAKQSKHQVIKRNIYVTQMEMSVTQFGFVGLMVTYPEKFGAAEATKEELESFLHTWRGICYLLGIEDKFNFCNGTLEEVVERCRSLIDNWVRPNFINVTKDWEHMSRCLVEGMGYIASTKKHFLSFEVSMMHLFWVLDIPAPRLYDTLTWNQRSELFLIKFVSTTAVKFPGFLRLLNWFLRRAIAKASSMSPETLEKLKSMKYEYEEKTKCEHHEVIQSTTFARGSLLVLLSLTRFLI